MIPVSKRMYIFHSKCIKVCKTWIKIVIYLQRYMMSHRPCVKTLRSANPWMNVLNKVNFSGFPCSGSKEQWTLCREHVNRNTVYAWMRTSNKLIIWIRCVNKERHAKYAERGGTRTGIENLWSTSHLKDGAFYSKVSPSLYWGVRTHTDHRGEHPLLASLTPLPAVT